MEIITAAITATKVLIAAVFGFPAVTKNRRYILPSDNFAAVLVADGKGFGGG